MPISKLSRRYGRMNQAKTPVLAKLEKQKKIKPPKSLKKWLKILIIAFTIVVCLGFISATMAIVIVSRDLPDPNKLIERSVSQSTKIYDRTGTHLLYEIYNDQKRTLIDLDQISKYAQQATVAVEDKYFYTHKGIRIPSIIRATVNNLLGRSSGGGGASTLTQQLIKNAVVGNEHSYLRKIKEAIMALRLEKKYTKDEILKMYLNEIPYGSTNYGIESASQSYFQKKAKDLTLAEAATLAALPQASTKYLNDPQALLNRRDTVLELMYQQNYITQAQKDEAQNTALQMKQNTDVLEAPHFILYVKQLLDDSFGEKTVDEGGLKVITTLDYDKQKIAESIVKKIGDVNEKKYKANNAALVAMDPKTGEVLSMVGSRDFNNNDIQGKYNVAVLGKRQPGSSLKPFIYLEAFAKGYTPETVIYDVQTNFDKRTGGNYTPKNYSGKEYGLVTMRSALQGSLNITAVKTLYLVGVEKMIKTATEKFGYTTLTGDYGLSLVLGGAEVTLLEHTAAYATLANEGVYNKPITILKVEDNSGKEIYKAPKSEGARAVDKKHVDTLSNVLSDDSARAYMFGANSLLTLPGRKVAVKTGTTDDSKDAWTMGYTPSLAVGVWVGNTKPSTMLGGGSTLAGPIWNDFMRQALDKTPAEDFDAPIKEEIKNPFLQGSVGGITLRVNKKTGKIASSSTLDELIVEKTFLPPHTILHYVDKDNPNSTQSNSQTDPQYDVWEEALQQWIAKQQQTNPSISISDPPTEYDTVGSSEMLPSLEIISPLNSSTLYSRQIKFEIKASAPRGISDVSYYLGDTKIGSSNQFPFSLNYYAQSLEKGKYTFKVIASDDQNNNAQAFINIDLQAELDPPSFEWSDSQGLTLKKENFPGAIFLTPFRWTEIKEIKIYLKSGANENLIYTFDSNDKLVGNKLNFTWKTYPGAGDYQLKGVMTDKQNKVVEKTLLIKVE